MGGYDTDEPDYESPHQVGDEVLVTGILTVKNSVGGTESIDHDGVVCKIEKAFWDYETGWRYNGRILSEADIGRARKQSLSSYDAEHYRREYPDQPHLAESAERAAAEYDPSKAYFCEHDISPVPQPQVR